MPRKALLSIVVVVVTLVIIGRCASGSGGPATVSPSSADIAGTVATADPTPAQTGVPDPTQYLADVHTGQPNVDVPDDVLLRDGFAVCPTGGTDAAQTDMETELAPYGVSPGDADDIFNAAWVDLCTNIAG